LEKLGRFLEKKKLGWSILEKQSWAGLFIGREIKKKAGQVYPLVGKFSVFYSERYLKVVIW